MEILIFDTHQRLSAIISPFKFMQHHSSEDCLFTLEKTCDVLEANKKQVPLNQFCQSNLEEQRKSYINS